MARATYLELPPRWLLNCAVMVTPALAPGRVPDGTRVYAIGDVHGCAIRLNVMHRQIRDDLARAPVPDPVVVHLGDYVDRGEDSASVLDLLRAAWPDPAPRVVNLAGNHEAMMLEALESGAADAVAHWLANGGRETLASWNLSPRAGAEAWRQAMSPAVLDQLRGLSLRHRVGDYVFVHAGLRPGVPMERQSRYDMLWIREPFLSWSGALPGIVVHGHTPEHEVVVRPNRIGVDTGAVMGGVLSCVVLEANRLRVLCA